MLDIVDLTCTRGDRQLFTELSFSLQPGSLLYVQGPNGCGKTTLLRALCGLFLQESGKILWQGKDVSKLGEDYRKHILYFGHHNAIKDDLTSIENLRINAKINNDAVDDEKIGSILETMGLYGYEDLPTRVLSQGQKRRAALARLMLSSNKLWILDEPFSALDVNAVDMLQGVISEHIKNNGMVILTTHQEVSLTSGQVQRLRING